MMPTTIDQGFRDLCEATVEQACTDYRRLIELGCIEENKAIKTTRFGNYGTITAVQALIDFIDSNEFAHFIYTAGLNLCPRAMRNRLHMSKPTVSKQTGLQ